MGQGFWAVAGLCASQRVNPRILFATQFGTLVIMPGDEGPKDHAENEFLQGLPPLTTSASEASTITSTPRCALWSRGVEASLSGPQGKNMSLDCLVGDRLLAVQQMLKDRVDLLVDSMNELDGASNYARNVVFQPKGPLAASGGIPHLAQ